MERLAPVMEGRHVEVGQLDLVGCDPGRYIAEADLWRDSLAPVLRAEGEIHAHLRRIARLRARAAHESEGDREGQQGLRHGSLSFVEAKVSTKATPGCHMATVAGVSPRFLTSGFMRKFPTVAKVGHLGEDGVRSMGQRPILMLAVAFASALLAVSAIPRHAQGKGHGHGGTGHGTHHNAHHAGSGGLWRQNSVPPSPGTGSAPASRPTEVPHTTSPAATPSPDRQ